MPAISRAGNALVSSADIADDRLSSRVEIIHATGQDTALVSEAWVKNTGVNRIDAITKSDVFFGPDTNFARIPYGGASCVAPCWEYELENDTVWNPTGTLHITIHVSDALAAGNTYYVKIVAANGVEDSKFFTL
jgi:hypothetical protein